MRHRRFIRQRPDRLLQHGDTAPAEAPARRQIKPVVHYTDYDRLILNQRTNPRQDGGGGDFRNTIDLWLWVPAQGRDECVREDVLSERWKSVLELVATP